ncbi:MAG: sugar transferase [Minwuia sp.]|uniref:sugar transferase n=1 Tax=Minwuia sp. TaxID=2493630 RepID=UPI003A860F8B
MKRLLDILLTLLAAPVVLPVCLIVAVLVARKLGRPVLFTQRRSGRGGRDFTIYKFRSMTNATDADGTLLPAEQRLTRFGRLLRATSLDELPQLLNVLLGDMSLVGPRPLLPEYNDRYNARQRRRLEVRPGITGLAQVKGRNLISWERKFELDVEYVETRSIWLDLRIIWMTVMLVFRRGAGVEPESGPIMAEFRGSAEGPDSGDGDDR